MCTHIFWHFPADPSSFCSRKYRIPSPAVPRSPALPPRVCCPSGKNQRTPCRRYPVITGILQMLRAHPVWSVRYPAPSGTGCRNGLQQRQTVQRGAVCPVAAPNSPPLSRNFSFQASPIAVSATNGPSPTHVEYAFMTPTTLSSAQPGIPHRSGHSLRLYWSWM